MVSVFDLEQLQSLLEDFHRITNIRITVFDEGLNELVSYPERCAPFCALIRESRQGLAACAGCDRAACAVAARENRTHIYRCHAGLTEAVTPLYVGKVLVGYLFFGHVFGYDTLEEGWEVIRQCCKDYPVDLDRLKAACGSCTQVSREYIRSAARILHATASHLVQERMATLQEDSTAARLDAYISGHFTEALSAQSLCRELKLGRTRLYQLCQQLYGCGLQQQIRRLRMDRAKKRLEDNPHMTIAQIAADCGYADYNYFIAVFSQTVGQSPGSYRKKLHS